MSSYREAKEGVQYQGIDERRAYKFDASPWGAGTITAPTTKVYDTADDSDVTSTVMPSGAASVTGSVITTPLLRALTAGKQYRVVTGWNVGGDYLEMFFFVLAEL